ncbi:cytochrome b [Sandaracinobacteroides saxicola]|uniref:Cytochrome b n=1 Tax=Sandaracinobacteroides saxicola TaxID=2759707 RepID=A0A7G5IDM3_9SPHN|nr:cytochrome b [Sandaracinobacteroides saxicola]QMW21465.1 cytochrome b [Sandaracinobacteroides saxicola]
MSASHDRYSRWSITLHWLIALIIIGNLAGGLLLESLFNARDPATRQLGFTVVQVHKSMGLTVLVLSLVRLAMRLREGFPQLPGHMTATERFLARVTHYGFYALMIGIPLSGWMMVSASPLNFPTIWFGLFEWPHLPTGTSKVLAERAGAAHQWLAYGAIVLLLLHVAGALKHHFMDRDDVLARMLPFVRRRA